MMECSHSYSYFLGTVIRHRLMDHVASLETQRAAELLQQYYREQPQKTEVNLTELLS